ESPGTVGQRDFLLLADRRRNGKHGGAGAHAHLFKIARDRGFEIRDLIIVDDLDALRSPVRTGERKPAMGAADVAEKDHRASKFHQASFQGAAQGSPRRARRPGMTGPRDYRTQYERGKPSTCS